MEVIGGRLRWLEATNIATGRTEQISLPKTLKTVWEFVDAASGKGKQILLAACRPDFKSAKDQGFTITYTRYYFDGTKWLYAERTDKGFTEFEEGFPDRKFFP